MVGTFSPRGGTLLADRYLLQEEIGSGGTGNVFRATDLRTGGPVAVKLLDRALAEDATIRARFDQEARAAAE